MLTPSEFSTLEKEVKSKKLTTAQVLKHINEKYVTKHDKANVRDKSSFVHKIETKETQDATREREKRLGVKVRTQGESQQGDSR